MRDFDIVWEGLYHGLHERCSRISWSWINLDDLNLDLPCTIDDLSCQYQGHGIVSK